MRLPAFFVDRTKPGGTKYAARFVHFWDIAKYRSLAYYYHIKQRRLGDPGRLFQ